MGIEVETVLTPRGSFNIRRAGPPEAPLVLALHGFPDVAATFDGLIEALVSAGFQVVAPQMRGYAPSVLDLPTSRTLFDTLAQDAIAIADSLAPDKNFSVIGHDNGAFATYSLLRLAGSRAVCAVTLTAGHPAAVFANSGKLPRQMWRSRYAMFFQVRSLSDWWIRRKNFRYLEKLWRRWAAPGWILPSAHLDEVKRTMAASWPSPLLHYRAMPFEGDKTPLSQPVLYLIGDQDGCVMPEAVAGQERFFTGPFQSEAVPGVGHFLHLEKPNIVLPKVVRWLETHGKKI